MAAGTDSATTEKTAPAADGPLPRELKLVLGLLLVAAFVMILNETIMSVALPTLMAEFGVSAATAQWLTTAFLLTMAVVIPTTGLILQRFSTRSVYAVAVGLFTAGTLLGAIAPSFAVLVGARVTQAVGTAIILPLLTTTVLTFVPLARRGRTMGLMSIVIAVAPAVGPTYSGFVLNAMNWRWMFLTVLPIAAVALVVGSLLVKDFSQRRAAPFDLPSIMLSAVAFGGLIYGLSSIGKSVEGDAAVSPWVPIAVGGLSLVVFVLRQLRLQRDDAALLDLRPFQVRSFVVGLTMLMTSMAALFGTLILLPIYLQQVLDLSTLRTGLTLLPGGLAMGLVAPFVGRAFDRWGPRPLVVPGSFVVAGALGLMWLLLDQSTAVAAVVAAHVLLSLGLGMVMTPLLTSTLGSLETGLYSHGSAIVNTLQQLAGAAGTAVFISVMTASTTSSPLAATDEVAAQAEGINDAFLWGGLLALVAAALSFTIRRPVEAHKDIAEVQDRVPS